VGVTHSDKTKQKALIKMANTASREVMENGDDCCLVNSLPPPTMHLNLT
jgi:hypothetical protein